MCTFCQDILHGDRDASHCKDLAHKAVLLVRGRRAAAVGWILQSRVLIALELGQDFLHFPPIFTRKCLLPSSTTHTHTHTREHTHTISHGLNCLRVGVFGNLFFCGGD